MIPRATSKACGVTDCDDDQPKEGPGAVVPDAGDERPRGGALGRLDHAASACIIAIAFSCRCCGRVGHQQAGAHSCPPPWLFVSHLRVKPSTAAVKEGLGRLALCPQGAALRPSSLHEDLQNSSTLLPQIVEGRTQV